MGKILVIKDADFSDVAVAHYEPNVVKTTIFNTAEQGKYRINYIPYSGGILQFLNLSGNERAAPWIILWADVTELRGETISIGKTQDTLDAGSYSIVFTDDLIDTITDKSYGTSSYNINDVQEVSAFPGNNSDTPLEVQVPNAAVGLYVSFITEDAPEIRIV